MKISEKNNPGLKARLLTSSVLAAMLGAASFSTASAQDVETVPQDAEEETSVQETVIITGSRLNQANLVASSPVTQINAEEIDIRGTTRIEDLVNILPQAFAGQTSDVSNGATGTSNLNLRGLGATRTLVLVDGKRLPYGSPQSTPANLDLIPSQLIEGIDIVTGGNSAVYGADAVGGVANFRLRRDFEGFGVDSQFGFSQDGNNNSFAQSVLAAAGQPIPADSVTDGREVSLAVYAGANTADGKGNVTAFFSFQDQAAILQSDRDVSGCALGAAGGDTSFEGVGCVGSSTFRRVFSGGDFFQEEDGTLVDFVGGPDQTFNFGPFNFFQRPNQRFNFTTLAHYELHESVEAYVDFTFVNNQTDAQIAPSGTFFRGFTVNCANPFLGEGLGPNGDGIGTFSSLLGCETPDDVTGELPEDVAFIAGRRNVEGGNRNSDITLQTFRTVGGFRGDFADNFSYDVFGQFSRTTETNISTSDLSFANVQDALNVVLDDNGNAVCASGNANCVPFNIFERGPNGESLVTEEATNFIEQDGFVTGSVQQIVFGGTVQGDLTEYGLKSPLAEVGIQALVGWEYREDELDSTPDAISQIPGGEGLTGVGGGTLPVAGDVSVYEFFGETQIPLVQGLVGVEELSFNGAYRYSDYSTDGNGVQNSFDSHTFALGLSWVPVDDLRLRGQFQRAVRAPTVINLFTGQNTGLFDLSTGANGLFDACAGDFDPATATPEPIATAAQCELAGVAPALFGSVPDNSAGQFNLVTGGNPLLDVEESDTFTIGAILQPRWVPGLTFSVDYFDISVDDAIGTIPATTIVDTCLETGDPAFCDLIIRDEFGSLFLSNGNFEGVQTTLTNIANLSTDGIDFAVTYSADVGNYGSVALDYVSTYLLSINSTPFPGGEVIECVGLYGGQCGTPNPEYRHRALVTWSTPWDLDLTATWRFTGAVDLDGGGDGSFLDDEFDAENYIDLAASYQLTDGIRLRGGVNNIIDNDPPLSTSVGAGAGNGNTFPGVYDATGRFIFLGFNAEF